MRIITENATHYIEKEQLDGSWWRTPEKFDDYDDAQAYLMELGYSEQPAIWKASK